MTRVALDFDLKFSNGTFVFNSLGQQISPHTREGRKIESILKRQKETRKENKAQTHKVETIIKKDIDDDGYVGKPTHKTIYSSGY